MSTNPKSIEKVSLLAAMRFSPLVFIDIVFGSIALNVLALALPLTLMQVYDRIISQKAGPTLIVLATGCAIAILLETFAHIARDRVASWCGSRFEFQGVGKAFENLLRSSLPHMEGVNTIDRLEELNSFSALKSTYFMRNIQNLIDLPFALANLILIFLLTPKIANFLAIMIAVILAVHLVLLVVVYISKNKAKAANISRDKRVLETFRFINTIRALTLEESVLRRVEKSQEKLAALTLKSINFTSLSTSFLTIIPQAAIFGVLLIGAEDVLNRLITVGTLTTAMMLAGRALAPVIALVSSWLNLEEKKKEEHNANALLTLETENWDEDQTFPEIKGEVKVVNLSFSHKKGSTPVISNVSLNVPAKTMLAIKSNYDYASTIFTDLLLRNLEPSFGSVFFDNFPMEDIPLKYFYRDVQYLEKDAVFFRGTILENLASFDVNLYDEAIEKSKLLGLEEAIAGFELGYTSMLDRENLLAMSTSLQTRMAITRAVVKNPRVLIINGVEHGMDIESSKFFGKTMRLMKGKCTIICVTNNPGTLSMADKVLYLRNAQFHEKEVT